VISLPVSALVLRLSGGYFAVATLVVAAVFQIVATLSPSVGGTTGVSVPGLAVAATLVASRGLWGLVSERFGWSLLPVGYRVRAPRR
jgi:branched-chain amino acid transport system permease protein